jgi:hypothetical protein
MSTSYYTPAGTSNDWLISPQFTVSGASPTLYWDAKSQDVTYLDGYKVMLAPNGGNNISDFTVQLYTNPGENSSWASRAVALTPYIGQTVRIAFVNNSTDDFLLLVDNIKVDYIFTQPPASYCGPLTFGDVFGDNDEPITLVNFAGINNTTDSEAYVGNFHEFFLNQTASVTQGQTYDITLKGNTVGDYEDSFAVFIDWNQNGSLNDPGEVYQITQTIENSSGTDAIQAIQAITVPANATPGTTRMRVKKIFGTIDDDSDFLNPCMGSEYGQAEDYSVNVIATNLAVQDAVKKNSIFKAYPNPVTDILTIDSQVKIKIINVYDAAGRSIISTDANSNKLTVNLTKLAAGIYIVTAETENGKESVKVIKK